MRFSKTKALALAVVVLLLGLAVIVAASMGLFSGERNVNVHLEAGTLDAGLYRTSLTGVRVREDGGFDESFRETERVDLVQDGTEIFVLQNAVPGVWQEAVLEVENRGSAAFDYSVSIVEVRAEGAASLRLLEELEVTVTDPLGRETVFSLAEAEERGPIALGSLGAGAGPASFSVKVSFATDPELDNGAMGGSVSFDLSVRAVQQTVGN